MTRQLKQNSRKWWLLPLITGVILSLVFLILTPWNIVHISTHPKPAENYTEAVLRIDQLKKQEHQRMNPLCQLQLMTHSKTTDRAIVLVHGYTSCPRQFHDLGQRFYQAGYNVLIAPLPHHGLADPMTNEHGKLTAAELAAYADQTVDIARGLGKKVYMMGLSAGGVTTAWTAQNRKDIELAVIISPAFGFKKIPTALTGATMNIYSTLPDAFEWWDPVLEEKVPPPYSYPRYSRHALVEILRLGFTTLADAHNRPPAAKKLIVVLNANDTTVNNELTRNMITIWQSHKARVTTDEFESNLSLPHDLIDPSKPNQRTDIVYPRLMELINGQ